MISITAYITYFCTYSTCILCTLYIVLVLHVYMLIYAYLVHGLDVFGIPDYSCILKPLLAEIACTPTTTAYNATVQEMTIFLLTLSNGI